MNGGGLYVHVPFCHGKCAYCDFYSMRVGSCPVTPAEYHKSLEKEWTMRHDEIETYETIYFGGGTPSVLNVQEILSLTRWLPSLPKEGEFTVEFNPEDVLPERLEAWVAVGANRASMGVQSLNDVELKAVGRRHSASQALAAYSTLRRYFDNISVDVIIGLPGQTEESLTFSLNEIISLRPEHISAYILTYEEGTRLYAMRSVGKIKEFSDDILARRYLEVCQRLKEAGYMHYEVSNFSLPGKFSRHNSSYWCLKPYLGLGPGAHSYSGEPLERRINPDNLFEWHEKCRDGIEAYVIEKETPQDKINNIIMLSLRTSDGLDLTTVPQEFRQAIKENIEHLPSGRIVKLGEHIHIPESSWLLSDDTICRLMV